MPKAQINFIILDELMAPAIEKACGQKATKAATSRFIAAKEEFLDNFITDDISQEIAAGGELDASTIIEDGNLFGFIGFQEGTKPIEKLYEYLDKNIVMNPQGKYDRKRKTYDFYVVIPSKEDIAAETPMPWGTSRSWVFAIESGISGLNNYLFKASYGRSGGGFQANKQIRSGKYTPRKYMSSLLNFLEASLQG